MVAAEIDMVQKYVVAILFFCYVESGMFFLRGVMLCDSTTVKLVHVLGEEVLKMQNFQRGITSLTVVLMHPLL